MERNPGLNNSIDSNNKKNDIILYIKYCYEQQSHLEKAKNIRRLWRDTRPYFAGGREDSNILFVEKFVEFENQLEKYKTKNVIGWFDKAFDNVFKTKTTTRYKQIVYEVKQLAGFIVNRDKNLLFQGYRDACSSELRQTLGSSTKGLNNTKHESEKDVINILKQDNSIDNIIDDDTNYTEYDFYEEQYQVPISDLEKKLACLLEYDLIQDDRKIKIENMINSFRKEEEKNYSEEQLNEIIGLFFDKNEKFIKN